MPHWFAFTLPLSLHLFHLFSRAGAPTPPPSQLLWHHSACLCNFRQAWKTYQINVKQFIHGGTEFSNTVPDSCYIHSEQMCVAAVVRPITFKPLKRGRNSCNSYNYRIYDTGPISETMVCMFHSWEGSKVCNEHNITCASQMLQLNLGYAARMKCQVYDLWSVTVWLNSLIEMIFYNSSYYKLMKFVKASH